MIPPKRFAALFLFAALSLLPPARIAADQPSHVLRAGAHAIDVTPDKLPVKIIGGFLEATADKITDRIHARCLVLDDGETRIAISVVDSCMMPRELLDEAKRLAREKTGIPEDRMLISATHTHSAPAAMGGLGCAVDPEYPKLLPGRIAEGIARAQANLAPAKAGWAVIDDWKHTHNRRWIYRPDKMLTDPFGNRTVRANMHPGYQNPDAIGPSGPVDPGLTVVSFQALDGRPIAVLANYSMHYFGAAPVSADYYGLFAEKIAKTIGAVGLDPPFVAMMSQGTSGDQMWMDYGKPARQITLDAYADEVALAAHEAYKRIQHREGLSLAMAEAKLALRRRVPDGARLAWARDTVAKMEGRKPANIPEVYAHEQIYLHDEPVRELKLQALRIGDLGIAAIPDEVFAITGLKLKAMSPLATTFTIELANGSEGYIPPPEQHKLGGYTTWPARTAALEPEAEPKIVEAVLGLLEKVSGKPRREPGLPPGPYAKTVLDAKPHAYWRLDELAGPRAADASGNGCHGVYGDGVAFYLAGPEAAQLTGTDCGEAMAPPRSLSNRCPHLAGGTVRAQVKGLGRVYSIELWFWNGLADDARQVTGWLFSRGGGNPPDGGGDGLGSAGDGLGIGGTAGPRGKLFFASGGVTRAGERTIQLKTWHHVVLARDERGVTVYLDGHEKPEISGALPPATEDLDESVVIGGRDGNPDTFEGKIDEVAVHGRALTAAEAAEHEKASRD